MPWEWVDRREPVLNVAGDTEAQTSEPSQPLLNDGKRKFRPAGSPAGTCPQGPVDSMYVLAILLPDVNIQQTASLRQKI